jgi:hypothetical protein
MLINCPDCNSEVSDLALACPRCAGPIAVPIEQPVSHSNITANEAVSGDGVAETPRGGAITQVCHPIKGIIEGMTITLAGDGGTLGAEDRRITDRLCLPSPTSVFEHLDLVVKSTFSWTGFTRARLGEPEAEKNEKDVPCTRGNVRKLYDDPRFKWLRQQVEIFVTRGGARYMSALRWCAYLREHATTFQSREPHGLAEIIGQSEVVQRLTKLADLAVKNGNPLRHVLLLGPEGSGKRKIAREVARQLGAKLTQADSASSERPGDLAAIVNDLDQGDILLLLNVNRMRKEVANVLPPAMRRFALNINVGDRVMTLPVKPFTLIGTAQKESDCPRELLDSFDLVLQLQKYSEPEMVQLVERLAGLAVERFTLLRAAVFCGRPSGARLRDPLPAD